MLEEVEQAVNELVEAPEKPDAILTTSDKLTTGCFRILKSKGVSVPAEMGLVGFSNSDLTELLDPPYLLSNNRPLRWAK